MIAHPAETAAQSPSPLLADADHPDAPPALPTEALFRQLVQDHRHRLYRFIVKHIGWGSDAEDLTQQAFVEAAQSYASFRGASELSTWLYHHDPQGRILVVARIRADKLVVTLTDAAPPFNPLLVPEPDTKTPLAEREIGGLGLLFVRRTADCFSYRQVRGPGGRPHNQVCFSKRLLAAPQASSSLCQ